MKPALNLDWVGRSARRTVPLYSAPIARQRFAGFAHPMMRWFSFLVPSIVRIDGMKIWSVK